MAINPVSLSDTFSDWKDKTNQIIDRTTLLAEGTISFGSGVQGNQTANVTLPASWWTLTDVYILDVYTQSGHDATDTVTFVFRRAQGSTTGQVVITRTNPGTAIATTFKYRIVRVKL